MSRRPRVLVADPPWKFGDTLPGNGRGAEKHYGCLTLAEICNFPVPSVADNCWLFLWRVASMQDEALAVGKAWGFGKPKSELVWRKVTKDRSRLRMGMGRTVRNSHETCLIFKRGKPDRLSMSIPSTFDAPRQEHSRKPDEFYRIVDEFAPGPKVELFARRQWEGWECLGEEMAA